MLPPVEKLLHCPLYDDDEESGIRGVMRSASNSEYSDARCGNSHVLNSSNPFCAVSDTTAMKMYRCPYRIKHNMRLLHCNGTAQALQQEARGAGDDWTSLQRWCTTHKVWRTPWYVMRCEWACIHRNHVDSNPTMPFHVRPGISHWDLEWGTGDITGYYGDPEDLLRKKFPNVVDVPFYSAPDGPWESIEISSDASSAMTSGASDRGAWGGRG